MGGTEPAKQARLSFTGSEGGEAETATLSSDEALIANDDLNLTSLASSIY